MKKNQFVTIALIAAAGFLLLILLSKRNSSAISLVPGAGGPAGTPAGNIIAGIATALKGFTNGAQTTQPGSTAAPAVFSVTPGTPAAAAAAANLSALQQTDQNAVGTVQTTPAAVVSNLSDPSQPAAIVGDMNAGFTSELGSGSGTALQSPDGLDEASFIANYGT